MTARIHELPGKLPGKNRHLRRGQTTFGGLVAEGRATGYDLCDMTNLGPVGYPALSTRPLRRMYINSRNSGIPHGMTRHRGQVVFAQGDKLYVSPSPGLALETGTVSDTDKHFVPFGDNLFILPDKIYYNSTDGQCHPVELDSGVLEDVVIESGQLTTTEYNFHDAGFRSGDCFHLEVQGDRPSYALDGYYKIGTIIGGYMSIIGTFPTTGTYNIRVRREMPSLEGAFALGDRLYGYCGHTVMVCEAGNPFNWYARDISFAPTAPFLLETGDDESFTACTPWQGYPLFFKTGRICKLMGVSTGQVGAYPIPSLSEQPMPGVASGMAATLCEVGGALYYCANSGVYRYTGTYPQRISGTWSDGMTGGCGGTDGRAYYLSAMGTDGVWRTYLYRPADGEADEAWYVEDEGMVAAFSKEPVPENSGLSCLVQRPNGDLWMARSFDPPFTVGFDEAEIDSHGLPAMAEFGDERACEPDGVRLLMLELRARGNVGDTMTVKIRYDGDTEWKALGSLTGNGHMTMYRVPGDARRCEWYRLRLEMTGSWRLSGLWRELETVGS